MASFPDFNGTGSVYVCVRKLTSIYADTNAYEIGYVYVKTGKTRHFTVCGLMSCTLTYSVH